MEKRKVGFAMTGSFCTWSKVVPELERLTEKWDIVPIFSQASYETDSRFGKASDWIEKVEKICGHEILHTLTAVEPIGPKKMVDMVVVSPCTGNTLGKLANGITDTPVTLACKANLRNGDPVLLAVSTNDALGASARNIGTLMNTKNVYFVPMAQDDPFGKPASLVAHFDRLGQAIEEAFAGRQIQPVFL